ncbi:MAG: methyltransferase [Micropruina sp.]|nr:methyltransferase [Micropruina sp.]
MDCDRLRDHLRAAAYDVDAVGARLGASGLAGLARNTTLAAADALGSEVDAQATLIRLFLLQQEVAVEHVRATLGEPESLLAAGVLASSGEGIRAGIELRPYATDEGFDGLICSDLAPNLDGRLAAPRPDFVLGVSPASTTLAQLTVRTPVGSALDLGTGCGVQSLHLSTHADRVVATDLNPRAVAMARLTARLNGIELDVREGSLYQPVAAEAFDLIVANPPYVMSPPGADRLVYREGSMLADDLVRQVITEGAGRLNPGGVLQVLGNWAITEAETWSERLEGWIRPTGCDALVLQREHLDPYEYIEIWLADAGLLGTGEYRSRYREWVDYFDHLGIVGVGLGWITLYNTERATPQLTIQEWPHLVHQPVGQAFADHPAALNAAALEDHALLASTWMLADDVIQETLGLAGAADPAHIVLRQTSGFGRAVEADTGLAAVLGACDGDLPLGLLIGGVADLLDADQAALAADLLPRLRPLIAEGLLRPAE